MNTDCISGVRGGGLIEMVGKDCLDKEYAGLGSWKRGAFGLMGNVVLIFGDCNIPHSRCRNGWERSFG